jgi:hypothetical protein
MNSNHCSKLALLVVALVASAGIAGAVSISGDVADEREVGSEVSVTYEMTEPFQPFKEWTLRGSSDLENVTWTVREIDTANQTVRSVTYPKEADADAQTFEHPVSQGENVERLTVTIMGDVPNSTTVSDYTYDPPNRLTVAAFTQAKGNNAEGIATFRTHPYTNESRQARDAIDSAREVINGSDAPDGARTDLQNAIDFYDAERFDEAITNAERAEQKVEQANQQDQLVQVALFGGGAVVVLVLLIGGFYWYRQNQTGSKL